MSHTKHITNEYDLWLPKMNVAQTKLSIFMVCAGIWKFLIHIGTSKSSKWDFALVYGRWHIHIHWQNPNFVIHDIAHDWLTYSHTFLITMLKQPCLLLLQKYISKSVFKFTHDALSSIIYFSLSLFCFCLPCQHCLISVILHLLACRRDTIFLHVNKQLLKLQSDSQEHQRLNGYTEWHFLTPL